MDKKMKSEIYKYIVTWFIVIMFFGSAVLCNTILATKEGFNSFMFICLLCSTIIFGLIMFLLTDIMEYQEKILNKLS